MQRRRAAREHAGHRDRRAGGVAARLAAGVVHRAVEVEVGAAGQREAHPRRRAFAAREGREEGRVERREPVAHGGGVEVAALPRRHRRAHHHPREAPPPHRRRRRRLHVTREREAPHAQAHREVGAGAPLGAVARHHLRHRDVRGEVRAAGVVPQAHERRRLGEPERDLLVPALGLEARRDAGAHAALVAQPHARAVPEGALVVEVGVEAPHREARGAGAQVVARLVHADPRLPVPERVAAGALLRAQVDPQARAVAGDEGADAHGRHADVAGGAHGVGAEPDGLGVRAPHLEAHEAVHAAPGRGRRRRARARRLRHRDRRRHERGVADPRHVVQRVAARHRERRPCEPHHGAARRRADHHDGAHHRRVRRAAHRQRVAGAEAVVGTDVQVERRAGDLHDDRGPHALRGQRRREAEGARRPPEHAHRPWHE